MNATTFKPIRNKTLMTAILPAFIPVDLKFLATVRTFEIIDGFALYQIKVAVPPVVSTLVAAEAFFLPLCYLSYFLSAVLAICGFACELCALLQRRFFNFISSAEGLHRVYRYADFLRYSPIAGTGSPQTNNLLFLTVRHDSVSSFRGTGLILSPSLTTEKFNPHR